MTVQMKKERVPALVVLPLPLEAASEAAKLGLSVRAQATLSGRCACGATTSGGTIEHEDHCPATAKAVEEAVRAGQVKWVALSVMLPLSV